LVSVIARLQNSVPVQAIAPRRTGWPFPDEAGVAEGVERQVNVLVGHVGEQQVLHVRGADVAAAEPLGDVGELAQLAPLDAAGEDVQPDPVEAPLLLAMDADVVTVDVAGAVVGDARPGRVAQVLDQLLLELLGPQSATRNFRRAWVRFSR
jgi:hypothetical protein